jgi:hypothetical protein
MSQTVLAYTVTIALLGASCGAASVAPVNPVVSPTRSDQERPTTEKGSRTAAQQKISSQLLYEIYRLRGEAPPKDIPSRGSIVKLDEKGRAFVDVRAVVTPTLERTIGILGGTIVLTAGQYHSILAWIPLLKLEQLAGDEAVISIMPAPEATTRR